MDYGMFSLGCISDDVYEFLVFGGEKGDNMTKRDETFVFTTSIADFSSSKFSVL